MGEISRVLVENIIHEWCQDGTGIPFIISNSETDGPRPANTYGTLRISSLTNTIINDINYENNLIDDDLDEIVRVLPIADISINIFGSDADDKMMKLRAYCSASKSKEFLMENKMGFQGMSDMRNLDILTHKTWEHRFQTDIKIGLSGEYIFKVDPIESVEIENENNGDFIEIP